MSTATSQQAPHDHDHAAGEHGHDTHHGNYVRIWGILLILLVISVAGPFLGHPVVTLVTAFGIAIVKAYLVAKNFMHINVAPRFVAYLVATTLVFMLLFFAGTSPDVMKSEGRGWVKPAWMAAHAEAAHGAPADAHGDAAHH
jgi:caa(3)-type oxidase subunit IV